MPGVPYRSELEPHWGEIRAWRAERWTWQAIADGLAAAHGLRVHRTGVQKYFARRVRRTVEPLGFAPAGAGPRPVEAAAGGRPSQDPFYAAEPEPDDDPFTIKRR